MKRLLIIVCATGWLTAGSGRDTADPGVPGAAVAAPSTDDRTGKIGEQTWLLPTGQIIRPAGRQVDLPGWRPQTVTLSPDGKFVAVAGGTKDVLLLDPVTGKELGRAAMPADTKPRSDARSAESTDLSPDRGAKMSFSGLAFSPDGSRLYVSSASGSIRCFKAAPDGKLTATGTITLPAANAPDRREEIAAGIAVSRDGTKLYVCGNLGNRLHEVDAADGRPLRRWDTGVAPVNVLLVGNRAFVACLAGPRPKEGDTTAPAGRGVLARADDRAIVAGGSVVIVDLAGNRVVSEVATGPHCGALAVSPDGGTVVAASAGSDTLTVIDAANGAVLEKICARITPADPDGAQPNALAFDAGGRTLYVANGTQNAVAAIRFDPRDRASRVAGLIPTAWFPSGLAFDAAHRSLIVSNLRGIGSALAPKEGESTRLNSHSHWGTVSLIPVPDDAALAAHTRTALEGMRSARIAAASLPARPGVAARPVPERAGEPSVFKHVVYVIKENRTYDQMLGDMKEGNGDAGLCTFGEQYTPNQHKLAREFVLLDNTYCNSVQSADGHQWTDSGIANEYVERQVAAGFPRSYPGGKGDSGVDALNWATSGFVWDHVTRGGKTFLNLGEWMISEVRWADPSKEGKPSYQDIVADLRDRGGRIRFGSRCALSALARYSADDTVGWDLNVPDQFRADKFIEKLRGWEASGGMPDMIYLFLPNDHTGGTRGKGPTPGAQIADNDLALGRVVEALSHSRFWSDTVLLCIEDDPQAGWDHVSGYRTTCFVASAWTHRRRTVSTHYNHDSLLRTIELVLGLPPMNRMTASATPMFDVFADHPDPTPFDSTPNRVALDTTNPEPGKIANPLLRKLARESSRLPLDVPDAIEEGALNRILWHAMKGPEAPFPTWAVHGGEDLD